jgi:hypothetical protein
MFSPRQHLKMSQRLRRKARTLSNLQALLRASAKFLGLAKLAIATRLPKQPLASPNSETLNHSEIERLRQRSKETQDLAAKAFPRRSDPAPAKD